MVYQVLADVVMAFHLLFLLAVVFGGFVAWRWPKAWFGHALLAFYGLVVVAFGLICPLTPLEDDLRRRAGQQGLEPTGFIDTYLEGVVYPADQIILARWIAFSLIAVSWAGLAVILRRRRRRRAHRSAGRRTHRRMASGGAPELRARPGAQNG
ncbi:MAG TPA: DUF2784 domain-containing protein [Glycomyces sp.]|nr:DUF2784 domain-containing protein [Glycomyces sp.]